MDMLRRQSREVQAILVCSVLYFIFSLFDWQQVSILNVHAGISEWHGIGVVAGLLVVALILWEAARLLRVNVTLGPITPGLGSIGLALLLLLFTVLTFLTHNEARHWPSWIGLILSIVIAVAAFGRSKAEGVDVREFGTIATNLAQQARAEDAPAPTATAEEPPHGGAQTDA